MNTKKLTSLAILTSLALIIFTLEAQLPPLTSIPGIKIGLANIITLITLIRFGRREAFCVLFLRIVLGSIFTGTFVSFLYSITGGIFCFAAMACLIKFFSGNKLWILSIFGAFSHNAGQIAAAVFITKTPQIIYYLPVLTISAVLCGAATGLAAALVLKHIK